MTDAPPRSDPDTEKDAAYWRHRALSAEMRALLLKPEAPPVNREVSALRARLIAMEESRSWKLTKPLRQATELMLSLKRKQPERPQPEADAPADKISTRIATYGQFSASDAQASWTELMTGKPARGASE